jgi:alpha-tubulin suppressor-like RCC1 family protein
MTFTICEFQISDTNIENFRRWVKKPMDCVINALEIIGVLDQTNADLMRIAVGDYGFSIGQIQAIFKYIWPDYEWRFYSYSNISTLVNYTNNIMTPGNVIFCGYVKKSKHTSDKRATSHVLLIGKRLDHKIIYIDPQIDTFCDLNSPECYKYIARADNYFILQSSASIQQLQQMQI